VRPPVLVVSLLTLAIAGFALWPREEPAALADPCGPVTREPSEQTMPAAGQATICLVNRERTQRGLPPLRQNSLLTTASAEHSQDMVERNYFEHTTPDGRTLGDRLRAIGYSRGISASAGENIAYGVGYRSAPAHIVDRWMHSPGHRADILRPSFTEVGIGIALGAPEVSDEDKSDSATYTTDFGGVVDPSLPSG
jgi:uncharacterized protein YkwD